MQPALITQALPELFMPFVGGNGAYKSHINQMSVSLWLRRFHTPPLPESTVRSESE